MRTRTCGYEEISFARFSENCAYVLIEWPEANIAYFPLNSKQKTKY